MLRLCYAALQRDVHINYNFCEISTYFGLSSDIIMTHSHSACFNVVSSRNHVRFEDLEQLVTKEK